MSQCLGFLIRKWEKFKHRWALEEIQRDAKFIGAHSRCLPNAAPPLSNLHSKVKFLSLLADTPSPPAHVSYRGMSVVGVL